MIINALKEFHINIEVSDPEDCNGQQTISYGEKKCKIRYIPNDKDTSWKKVIKGFQSIVPENIIFKQDYYNGGSDTDVYAVLTKDDWKHLYDLEPRVINYLFKDI